MNNIYIYQSCKTIKNALSYQAFGEYKDSIVNTIDRHFFFRLVVPQTVRSYHALSCLWCATCSVVIFGDVGRAMVGTACSSFAEAVREASTSPITGNHRYHPSQQGSKTSTWKYACLNKARIWLCQSKVGFWKMRGVIPKFGSAG